MKFREKTYIEAEQFDMSTEMLDKYHITWKAVGVVNTIDGPEPEDMIPMIKTVYGLAEISDGDWVATGVNGEHWPIADDVFKKTYESNEPCVYCRSNNPKYWFTDSKGPFRVLGFGIESVIGQFTAMTTSGECSIKINYCPMCGRKLGDD